MVLWNYQLYIPNYDNMQGYLRLLVVVFALLGAMDLPLDPVNVGPFFAKAIWNELFYGYGVGNSFYLSYI